MKRILLILLIMAVIPAAVMAGLKDQVGNSVGRLHFTRQAPQHYSPWRWNTPQRNSCQTFVVGRNLLMAPANRLRNANAIELQLDNASEGIEVRIVLIDYDRNLALLEGDLPEEAVVLEIPPRSVFEEGSAVQSLWRTSVGRLRESSAVLDRVDVHRFSLSYQTQLVLKTAKSSQDSIGFGAPVFRKNSFFGMAVRSGAADEYAVIPCEAIHRAIDISRHTRRAPSAMQGFLTSGLLQPAYRQKLGVKGLRGGCLITKVMEQGSGIKMLQEGDVLLRIAGHNLDARGRYKDNRHGKLPFSHLFAQHALEDKISVCFMRNAEMLVSELDLSTIDDHDWLIPRYRAGEATEYWISGGFVFQPLTMSYLQAWGGDWRAKAPIDVIKVFEDNRYKIRSEKQQQLVLLSQVLAHDTNRGLQEIGSKAIAAVNGKPVRSLKHLKKMIGQSNESVKLTFCPGGEPLLLSPAVLRKADADITREYGITKLEYFRQQ